MPSAIPQISQTAEVDRKLFATWQATLGLKAKPTKFWPPLSTKQHLQSQVLTSTSPCGPGAFNQVPKTYSGACELQFYRAAGQDPKRHSKTLANARTCWTKDSHASESSRTGRSETAHSQKLPGLPESSRWPHGLVQMLVDTQNI